MLDYHICDVFTDRAFSGNPLAIVLGADGLNATQMQIIARQFNLSETIFVMAPRDPDHTARVRIFLPGAEIPFAGHPTIGCALHLSAGRDGLILLEEEAGLVPVRVRQGEAEFVAPRLPVSLPGGTDAELIAQALNLPRDAIGWGAHHPGTWQGGPAFLFVPLVDLAALAAARPAEPHWSRLTDAAGVDKVYLYTPEDQGYRARMLAPTAGVPEDPATGAASAILAAQLLAAGALPDGQTTIRLRQGVEMGRPSDIRMTASVEAGSLHEVRVAGRAVPIASGRIRVPEDRR
ncbi:PhzF family phenazine biosynthesis protein [Paracoccus salsus]|uniref:PhzF family phenazine biosynthesis protein n=1 Tax=Paracoccus salsus TaxID=2911061 RepID=UPI001F22DB49|nr:PhzF family phenazine biosynthesis protein [Paracoccus salsus]MCF3973570.1 PhzF family phenazine biosynthesis protein [Paracoccus salsus]